MKKLASIPLDITDELLAGDAEYIADLVSNLPEATKTASVPSAQEQAVLPYEKVALVLFHPHLGEIKKFACYNRELCEVNFALLSRKKTTLPDELVKVAATNLAVAGKRHGVTAPEDLSLYIDADWQDPVVNLTSINKTAFYRKLKKHDELVKQAATRKLADNVFALPKERRYPIDTEEHVKLAISYFDQYYLQLEPENRLRFALNTANAADRFGVKYASHQINKYASLSPYKYNTDTEHHILMREGFVEETDKVAYRQLAEKCRRIGILKTASELSDLDEKTGVTRVYSKYIQDPLISVLGNTKVAMREIDDRIITQEMVNTALDGDGKSYVDEYTASELRGDDGLDVLASLPLPIRENLYSVME